MGEAERQRIYEREKKRLTPNIYYIVKERESISVAYRSDRNRAIFFSTTDNY